MQNDETLNIVVKLQDMASAGLAEMSAKMKTAMEASGTAISGVGSKMTAMGNSMESFGKSMSSAGRSMSVGLSLPIALLGKEIVDTSMKFEASMELIRTQAGASQAEVDNMTKAVLDLSRSGETSQGPQKLADGLYHLESLGLRGAEAMDTLKLAAQGADLGLADMEGVTNALGAAMVTGIDGTQSATQAMGLLDATIGQGNMKMDDMVAALGTGILPAAKNFGLGLRDVGAALATLTDNGMRADESATRLRMTFSLMAAPTQNATDALKTIGLTQYQLAEDMRSKGIVGAIQDLKTHLDESGQSATQQAAILSEAFGGGRTSAAILTLVQQSDRLKTKFDAIGESAGSFQEKINATHETNLFKMNTALASMQATLVDLGGTVMPIFATILEKISKKVAEFSAWWDTLSPKTKNFIVDVTLIVAVVGPLLLIFGALTTAIGAIIAAVGSLISLFVFLAPVILAISAPVWLVIAAVAALGVAAYELWKHWDVVSKFFKTMWADVKSLFADGVNYLIDAAQSWANSWVDAANMVIKAINSIHISIPDWVPGIGGKSFSSNIPTISSISLPHFEMGGTVPGLAGEPQLIVAHGGEQVVSGKSNTGSGVGTIINNITISGNSNPDAIVAAIDDYMRPLLQNAKLVHV